MTPPETSTSKPSVKTPPKQPVAVKKLVKPEKAAPDSPDESKPSTEPVRVPASSELASQLELLHERLDRMEKSVERLHRRTPSVFGRFVMDLAKVVLLAALLTVAWQTGWISQFLEWAAGLSLTPSREG